MMSSITNPRKRSRESKDRITNLPDCLKTKILSCLPTKDAVRTSVLSKEWKLSWIPVTNLDFYIDLNTFEVAGKGTESFTSFVTRLLILRDKAYLQRFRLSGYEILSKTQPQTQQLINFWIAAVLFCSVEEIDLFVLRNTCINMDSRIFLSKTLVVLKLNSCGYLVMPSCVNLPRLKTLYLEDIQLEDERSISSLLSACPVLEELKLRVLMGYCTGVVNIIAPVLTVLIVEHLQYHMLRPVDYEIVLDTPALQYLNITDEMAIAYKLNNLSNLTEAVIVLERDGDALKGHFCYFQYRGKAITDLLSGVSHVQRLILPWGSLVTARLFSAMVPTFSCLTYMEVSISWKFGWDLMLNWLEHSPRLEALYLKLVYVDPKNYDDSFINVPPCFLSHLKVIRVDYFKDDMDMVKYFLLNAIVLEKLSVAYSNPPSDDSEKCAKILKHIEMLPRSSPTCKIEVS